MMAVETTEPHVRVHDDEKGGESFVVCGSEYRELLRIAREHVTLLKQVFHTKRTAGNPDWAATYWDCRQGLSLEDARAVSCMQFRDGLSYYEVVGTGHRREEVSGAIVNVVYGTCEVVFEEQVVRSFDAGDIVEMYHDPHRRTLVVQLQECALEFTCYDQAVLRSLYYALLLRHQDYRASVDPVAHVEQSILDATPRQPSVAALLNQSPRHLPEGSGQVQQAQLAGSATPQGKVFMSGCESQHESQSSAAPQVPPTRAPTLADLGVLVRDTVSEGTPSVQSPMNGLNAPASSLRVDPLARQGSTTLQQRMSQSRGSKEEMLGTVPQSLTAQLSRQGLSVQLGSALAPSSAATATPLPAGTPPRVPSGRFSFGGQQQQQQPQPQQSSQQPLSQLTPQTQHSLQLSNSQPLQQSQSLQHQQQQRSTQASQSLQSQQQRSQLPQRSQQGSTSFVAASQPVRSQQPSSIPMPSRPQASTSFAPQSSQQLGGSSSQVAVDQASTFTASPSQPPQPSSGRPQQQASRTGHKSYVSGVQKSAVSGNGTTGGGFDLSEASPSWGGTPPSTPGGVGGGTPARDTSSDLQKIVEHLSVASQQSQLAQIQQQLSQSQA